jgi:hypothetical protein
MLRLCVRLLELNRFEETELGHATGNVIPPFSAGIVFIRHHDHLAGSTGVFVLDTKNWRGVVSADGKGELLLNGKPTDKPQIRQFVGRVMGMKDKIHVLVPELDPYFQAVFVFTAARVDANWGLTGNVHCVRDDQLFDYIVEKDFGRGLKHNEAERIAQAFLGLAHMDRDFTAKSVSIASKT